MVNSLAPQSLISAVRPQIAAIDPDQPITKVQTMEDLLDASRAQPRLVMLLLAIFAGTAVALAAVGIMAAGLLCVATEAGDRDSPRIGRLESPLD